MNNNNDINDDEIRVIGKEQDPPNPSRRFRGWMLAIAAIVLLLLLLVFFLLRQPHSEHLAQQTTPFDSSSVVLTEDLSISDVWMTTFDDAYPAATTLVDTTVGNLSLTIMTPHNAKAELCVGSLDTNDASIIFATQAADIRHDNGKIVGAFVCKGEPKAWGLSKKGYCAIFDERITLGVADNSPLFEQATEEGGYFFRQYPLVNQGKIVDNLLENSALRRALCQWKGQVHVIVCHDRVTMNDFSNALVQLGVQNAIYLVGSTAYGYAIDPQGVKYSLSKGPYSKNANVNFIVFRR